MGLIQTRCSESTPVRINDTAADVFVRDQTVKFQAVFGGETATASLQTLGLSGDKVWQEDKASLQLAVPQSAGAMARPDADEVRVAGR